MNPFIFTGGSPHSFPVFWAVTKSVDEETPVTLIDHDAAASISCLVLLISKGADIIAGGGNGEFTLSQRSGSTSCAQDNRAIYLPEHTGG